MPKGLFLTVAVLLTAFGLFGVLGQNLQTPEVGTAKASTSGVCQTTGVTLVVDFGAGSGKETLTECAENFEGNGWGLMEHSGLTVEGTAQYPDAFVCRINGWPSTDNQDCLDTPTYEEGSWVYFKTLENGAWVRSGQGAADPANILKCGSAEGWVFITASTPEQEQQPSVSAPKLECSAG
ncbi:MAG: hypothetical protein RIS82_731 [Actinomycetota bacterium]|jgi:hypothetical protein